VSHRYIEESALRRVVRQAIPNADQRAAVLAAIDRYLVRQPRLPRLIGTTAAAKVLGIRPPHVSRLRDQGRMPEAVPVEGSNDVYVKDDVEDLAKELHARRQARERKREETSK